MTLSRALGKIFVFAMDGVSARERTRLEQLNELTQDQRSPLKSVYKNILVLSSSKDVKNLTFLLNKDLLGEAHQNSLLRHLLCLKYLAQMCSLAPESYKAEKLDARITAFKSVLEEGVKNRESWGGFTR